MYRGDDVTHFVVVSSARYPDASRVELPPDIARMQIGEDILCVVTSDATGAQVGLRIPSHRVPKAPPLWFGEVRENSAQPPAVNLMAFTGAGQAAGSLVDASRLRSAPVGSPDQLGAVRWYPATGEIDQVYVQPAWRRRSVATALLVAAGSLSVARGWPRLWSDGQRTAMGEALRDTSPWRDRAAELTHVAPPMTPGDTAD